jgi:hypothetical protein
MNKQEMRAILSEHLARYQGRTHSQLRALVESNQIDTFEVRGESGASYQIEIQFSWDDKPQGDIRVHGSIDENPHRPLLGFLPIYVSSVTDDFILSPQGTFVGE